MSSIRVKWQTTSAANDMFGAYRTDISSAAASIRSIKSNRCMRGRNFTTIYKALDKVISDLEEEKSDIKKLQQGLSDVLKAYDTYENRILAPIKGESLKEVNVNTDNGGNSSGGGQGGEEKHNPFELTWKNLWNILGKGGIVGAGVSTIGKLITGNWSRGYNAWKTGISSAKSLLSAIGGISGTIAKGANAEWAKSLFGLNNGLSKLDLSGFGKTFKSSLEKQFGSDLSFKTAETVGDKVKVATKWAGHILTTLGNVVDNLEEFDGKANDIKGITRMSGEIVVESLVDIGLGALATAGVSATIAAALAAAGVTVAAPAVVVGAGAAAVTWAANGVCKWITGGRDIGEVTSDLIFDTVEAASNWVVDKIVPKVGNAVKAVTKTVSNGVKTVSNAVSKRVNVVSNAVGNGVKKVRDSLSSVAKWGKRVVAFV